MSNNINKILEKIHRNSPHNKYWNISWDLGVELSNLTKQRNPKTILEVGTSNGFSSLCILKYLEKDSTLTTIDVDESRFNEAKEHFKQANVQDQVKQIQKEVFEVLKNDELNTQFDMIFLDAAQRKYLELIKLLENKNLIRKDTLIIADNVLSHKNMDDFLNYMKENYTCYIIEKDSGFLVATLNN